MSGILRDIATHYGLNYQSSDQNELNCGTEIFLQNHSRINFTKMPPYRAYHMIRDPRDVLVSSYFYHLWTSESWAHVPMRKLPETMRIKWSLLPLEEHGELSYQQYLRSLNQTEGLIAETKRLSKTFINEVADWDYNNPYCMEIKYEVLLKNEQDVFEDVFRHYGFNEKAIEVSLGIAEKHSFSSKTGRSIGLVSSQSHLRSGLPGEWRRYFDNKLTVLFKSLCGDALIKTGYEKDIDW